MIPSTQPPASLRRLVKNILSVVGAHPNYIVFHKDGWSREQTIERLEQMISDYVFYATDPNRKNS